MIASLLVSNFTIKHIVFTLALLVAAAVRSLAAIVVPGANGTDGELIITTNTEIVSDTTADGTRTVVVRDLAPLRESQSRFLRLQIIAH
jgi:hypothetical protein